MATTTAYQPFDMDAPDSGDGELTVDTPTHLQVTSFDGRDVTDYYGFGFAFDRTGNLSSGTLSSMEGRYDGVLYATITGLSMNLVTFNNFLLVNDVQGAAAYMYAGNDVFFGSYGNDVGNGYGGDDRLEGNGGDDTARGGAGNDTLLGGAGNDRLEGDAGSDLLQGGGGDDTYVVDAADAIAEDDAAGTDTVLAAFTFVLPAAFENLTLLGDGAADGTGNALDNVLLGNAAVNLLVGQAGDDVLDGGGGADVLWGGAGNDTYRIDALDTLAENAGEGIDTVVAAFSLALADTFENLTLLGSSPLTATGNAADNVLTGNAGPNTLDGGTGDDTLAGGDGGDSYFVDAPGDVVRDLAKPGSLAADSVFTTVSFSLVDTYAENLTLLGAASIDATGNAYGNILVGNAGDNRLDGGEVPLYPDPFDYTLSMRDTLRGGAGNDTYVVDTWADEVIELDGEGVDTLLVTRDTGTLAPNVENLTLAGTATGGSGNALPNVMTGNALGNELRSGDTSADTLIGGAGDDNYIIDVLDQVIEGVDGGTDSIFISTSYSLAALPQVENLYLWADTGTLTGNDADNWLIGGDNLLGGAGNDLLKSGYQRSTLAGGPGNDIYEPGTADSVVIESADAGIDTIRFTIGAQTSFLVPDNVENVEILGGAWDYGIVYRFDGNAQANRFTLGDGPSYWTRMYLTGGDGNDTLNGGDSADTLDGGAGADLMVGRDGDDVFVLDAPDDRVVEAAGAGVDTLLTPFDATLVDGDVAEAGQYPYIENVMLTGSAAVTAAGNSQDNVLGSNAGDNALRGDLGTDTASYALVTAPVVVSLAIDTPQDTGGAGVDTLVSIENLTGSPFADTLTGDALANRLDGGAGDDTLAGGAGDDTYLVDSAGDVVIEAADAGFDSVLAAVSYSLADRGALPVERIVLTGTATIDATGSAADDILEGNVASNVLDGGDGNDTVSYAGATSVRVNLSLLLPQDTRGAGMDTLLNIENLVGSPFDDTLQGSDGNNAIDGGDGEDTLSFSAASAGVRLSLAVASPQETVGAGVDTVRNIEHLVGSSHDDTLGGSADDNTLLGGAGTDWLSGAAGNDVLAGEDGDDRAWGGDGTDRLVGQAGDDVLVGEAGNDTLLGDDGNDYLYGGAGNDEAGGGAGIDVLVMGEGDDAAGGGAGQDYFYMGDGADRMYGEAGVDVMIGEGGNDRADGGDDGDYFYLGVGDDSADGAWGNDIFVMDEGNDTAVGAEGQDYFYMGAGNDSMDGGAGVDVMLGELGNDTFNGGWGVDYAFLGPGGAGDNDLLLVDRYGSGPQVVYGFEAGGANDAINLRNSGWNSFAQVQAAISDYTAAGNFMIITLDDDTNIWLIGVQPAQLTAADFLFS